MDELLNKINDTFDNSINTSDEDVAIQLKILKGNINTLFKEAMAETPASTVNEVVNPLMPVTEEVVNNGMKSILVVDDSSIIRNYIDKICSSKYNVVLNTGGVEAVETLRNKEIDLLLLDLMMPGVDGFAVLDYLKEVNSTMPVIIISGDTTKETIDRAFTYNVIDMIEKPFPEKTLIDKISRILE